VRERAEGFPLRSGDFVRRDAVAGKLAAVEEIRTEMTEYYRQRAEIERWGPDVLILPVEEEP